MGRVCVAGYGFPAGRLGCQAQQSAPRGLALGFATLSANLRCFRWAAVRNPDGRLAPYAAAISSMNGNT